jgi:hypothetical protein
LVDFNFPTNKLRVAKVKLLPPPTEIRIRGLALTDGGDVFVSLANKTTTPARVGLFRLEFHGSDQGSWVPVGNTIAPYLHGPVTCC